MPAKLQGLYPAALYRQWEAGKVLPAYYFVGEDGLEKDAAKEKLLAALKPDASSFHRLSGPEVQAGALSALAGNLSLFGGKRLVWIAQAERVPAAEKKGLAEYLAAPNPDACVVFASAEWKTDPGDPLMAGAHALGGLVHFPPLRGKALLDWMSGLARAAGLTLLAQAAERLVAEAGEERAALRQELERLFLFCKGRPDITLADVLACLGYSVEETPDALARAVAAALAERSVPARRAALAAADKLLSDGEDPARLLNWLGYAAQHLLAAKRLMAAGQPGEGVKYKVRAFYDPDLAQHASRATQPRLLRAMAQCLEAEKQLKTGAWGASGALELKELILKMTA